MLPHTRRPSLSAAAALALGALVVATVAPPSSAASTKTTKSTKSTRTVTKTTKAPATNGATPTATTQPAPRRAGVPIKGWGSVSATEWPQPENAIVVRPLGGSVKVYPRPDALVASLRFDGGKTVYGRVTLLVVGAEPGWWKVLMPVRPNGTVGWVRAADVEQSELHSRIVIELDTNTLTYTKDGKVVLKDRVAAGTGGTPTPTGLFFVKEIVPQANPRGALGPVALGLSGYSEVLYSFAGGSGVIGIHGTNQPNLIGSDVSHGCVRMRNESIATIAAAMQLGTPVEIVKSAKDLPSSRWQLSTADALALAEPATAAAPTTTDPAAPTTTAVAPTSTAP